MSMEDLFIQPKQKYVTINMQLRISLNGQLYKTDTLLTQTPKTEPELSLLSLFESL